MIQTVFLLKLMGFKIEELSNVSLRDKLYSTNCTEMAGMHIYWGVCGAIL